MIEWRPVVGFEDVYEVSSHGDVRSLDRVVGGRGGSQRKVRGKVRMQSTDARGYRRVMLRNGNGVYVTATVHRLVLEAFVGPRPDGMVCCHNDGTPSNNCVENLRWDTQKANCADQFRHGTQYPASKTVCKHGHDLTPDNTYWRGGHRNCRTCRRENTEARNALKQQRRIEQGLRTYQRYSQDDIEAMQAARANGETYTAIGIRFGYSKQSVRRLILGVNG